MLLFSSKFRRQGKQLYQNLHLKEIHFCIREMQRDNLSQKQWAGQPRVCSPSWWWLNLVLCTVYCIDPWERLGGEGRGMINTELLSLEMYYSDQAQYREPCCLPARLPNNEGYEYPYTQQTIEPHLCIISCCFSINPVSSQPDPDPCQRCHGTLNAELISHNQQWFLIKGCAPMEPSYL